MKFKFLTALAGTFILLASVFAFQYFVEDSSAFNAARQSSDELYLESPVGTTRYQVFGDTGDDVVVFVSASNGYLEQWNPNIDSLVDAGYRVVAYDLFGQGLSDRPRVDHDLALYREQLDSIIEEVEADRVHLVGSSLGSIIATDYVLHYPARVAKLVAIGPAGWPSEKNSSAALSIPVLGEFVFHYFGKNLLQPRIEEYLYARDPEHWAVRKWEEYADYPGYSRSYLSLLRHSPVFDNTDGWKRLGLVDTPTMFIWGKQDVSFPYSNAENVAELIPHAEVVGLDKAAHWVNIEQAEQVNKTLLTFLQK